MTVQDKIVTFINSKGSSASFKELLEASKDGWANGVPVKERGLKIQLSKMEKLGKVFCDSSKFFWGVTKEMADASDASSIPENWSWFKSVTK